MAGKVVDIAIVAEEEEINIILAVVVGMVAERINSSKMINTIKEVVEEEEEVEEDTIKPIIKAMVTSTKADIAVEPEGGDTGAVEVRTPKKCNQPPTITTLLNFQLCCLNKHIIVLNSLHYTTFFNKLQVVALHEAVVVARTAAVVAELPEP